MVLFSSRPWSTQRLSVPLRIARPWPVTPSRSTCRLQPNGPQIVLWSNTRCARSSAVSRLSPRPRNSISTSFGPSGIGGAMRIPEVRRLYGMPGKRSTMDPPQHASVAEVHSYETAGRRVAVHIAQRRGCLAAALLIGLLVVRDVDAAAARIERPLVEDAGHALGVARRVVQDRVVAVRADIVERAHPGVVAAHHDQRDAGRMREQAIVEGLGQLRLVAGNDPRWPEQLLLLLLAVRLVGIEA